MTTKRDIDDYIRACIIRSRLRAGLSQAELAKWSGVSNIAMIEAGKKAISREGVAKILTALGVTLNTFHSAATHTENSAMQKYMELTDEGKRVVIDAINSIYAYELKKRFRE